MSLERRINFLEEAERFLRQGRPRAALEVTERFSTPAFQLRGEGRIEYWSQRSISNFLLGNEIEAESALAEAGGVTRQFFEMYKMAFASFASRRLPRSRSRRTRHEGLIRYNLDRIIRVDQKLGGDGYTIGQEMADIMPRR